MPSFEVYGLGQCALDCIGKIDAYPPPDVKCEFSDMVSRKLGGRAGIPSLEEVVERSH